MNQKTAQIIFVVFNLLALPIAAFTVYEFYTVNAAIGQKKEVIYFDSGTYYLLLITVFWVMSAIQYTGKNSTRGMKLVKKYAGLILIGYFIGMLILANVIPYYFQSKFTQSGYYPCDDPKEISRMARGSSIIYSKVACSEIETAK